MEWIIKAGLLAPAYPYDPVSQGAELILWGILGFAVFLIVALFLTILAVYIKVAIKQAKCGHDEGFYSLGANTMCKKCGKVIYVR